MDNIKIIQYIENAIQYHDRNSYQGFENNFLEFERFIAPLERSERINFIFNFLDCWRDTFGHEWLYYEPLKKEDWVKIANQIKTAIAANEKFESIIYKGRNLTTFFVRK